MKKNKTDPNLIHEAEVTLGLDVSVKEPDSQELELTNHKLLIKNQWYFKSYTNWQFPDMFRGPLIKISFLLWRIEITKTARSREKLVRISNFQQRALLPRIPDDWYRSIYEKPFLCTLKSIPNNIRGQEVLQTYKNALAVLEQRYITELGRPNFNMLPLYLP